MSIFLRVTLLKVIVLSRFLENYERFNADCWFTLLVLLFFLEKLKQKLFIPFFLDPDPKSEKNSGKSTNKTILALVPFI